MPLQNNQKLLEAESGDEEARVDMKKCIILLFLCIVALNVSAVVEKTLVVGETFTFSVTQKNTGDGPPAPFVTGNSIVVTGIYFSGNSLTMSISIKAVSPGYSSICAMNWHKETSSTGYVFHVVDVKDVSIASKLEIIPGETYTYNPIITDAGAKTTLNWTSSNTGVATVNSSGVVTGVSPGKTNIICTASNGVSSMSLVTVSPKLVEALTLDSHNQEIVAGANVQLQPTILPANTSSKNVKWMSTNENIAQVDDNGVVTAIAPGYCSIFCIADDGSRKYDKCLIHVLGVAASRADVNGDGRVSVTDAFSVIDVILNNN